MEALEEVVVPAVEVVGFPEVPVAVVEVDQKDLDWVVQVAAALEEASVQVLEQAKEYLVDLEAFMAPVVLMEVAPVEVLVALEASAEATAVGTMVASND